MVTTPDQAVDLIARLCALPELAEGEEQRSVELAQAIARRDTPALYQALMHGFSFQGISDANAQDFINRHGNADWGTVSQALAREECPCPKLNSFERYRGCRYRKAIRSCANPDTLPYCPVPELPLRKGVLNEQAFSLSLFIRDRCGGDLVGFIDQVIAAAVAETPEDPIQAGREALLAALGEVAGVSRKLTSMALADLLMAAGPSRPDWVAVGRSMVAIDSLVHNFLHRTGILSAYGAEHPYGQRCFRQGGCEAIIRTVVARIASDQFSTRRALPYPRAIQRAIWRFCAGSELNVCNGNNIKDTAACELSSCPLWDQCSRLPLRAGVQTEPA